MGLPVVLVQLDQRALDQEVQRIPDRLFGKGEGLIAFLVEKVRNLAVAGVCDVKVTIRGFSFFVA